MPETRPKRSSRRLGVNSDSGGVAAGQHETQPGMYFIMCEQMGSGEAFWKGCTRCVGRFVSHTRHTVFMVFFFRF
jgi:hypothetical protein